jgi:FG-GAP repeat
MDLGQGGAPSEPVQATIGSETLLNLPAGSVEYPVTVEIKPFADEAVVEQHGLEPWGKFFGRSCDIDGDIAVVGAPGDPNSPQLVPGYVSVLERHAGGFNNWGETHRIYNPPNQFPVQDKKDFGYAVAISGNTIVVGAPGTTYNGPQFLEYTKAYIFNRLSDGSWQPGGIIAINPLMLDYKAGFGHSVAISGDRVVVGAPWANGGPAQTPEVPGTVGQAFVFERNAGGPGAWANTGKLKTLALKNWFAGEPNLNNFGWAVDIDNNFIAVGTPVTGGWAFVFDYVGGSWGPPYAWYVFGADHFGIGSDFGKSVAIDASTETLAVGAPGEEKAWVYKRDYNYLGNWVWLLEAVLQSPNPKLDSDFGFDVALSEGTLVVGAPGHGHPYNGPAKAGSVYLFAEGHQPGCPPPSAEPDGWGWGLLARRTAVEPVANGFFGNSVAIDGDTFIGGMGGVLNGSVSVYSGMTPMIAGMYQLAVEVDPHDQVKELSELSGSDPSKNLYVVPQLVQFCIPALDQPDLSVDSVELVPTDSNTGQGYLVADTEGNQLIKAGLNVTVSMNGAFDGPLTGARLKAEIKVAGGANIVTGIWNPVTQSYGNDLVLPAMIQGDTVNLHLDIAFKGPALAMGDYTLEVAATVSTPPQIADVDPMNDKQTKANQHYTALEVTDCSWSQTYEKQMGNDDFNVTADFLASLALSPDLSEIPGYGLYGATGEPSLFPSAEFGSIGALSGGAQLTLMGFNLGDLVRFRALVERDPVYEYNPLLYPFMEPGYGFIGFDLQFVNLQNPLGPLDVIYALGPYDSLDLEYLSGLPPYDPKEPDNPGTLPEGFEITDDNGFKLSLPAFEKMKKVEKEKTFFPGGFPVTVKGAAVGSVGVDLTLEVSNKLRFDIAPKVDFSVSLNLELGECDFSCLGAEGNLILLNDTFTVAAGLGMTITEGPDKFEPEKTATALGALACFKVENVITILGGELKAFAIYPWFKWCKAFGIPYPCGAYIKKSVFPIIDWKGFQFAQKLIEITEPACCVAVDGFIDCSRDPSQVCGND